LKWEHDFLLQQCGRPSEQRKWQPSTA
jgi:hypothetical protein